MVIVTPIDVSEAAEAHRSEAIDELRDAELNCTSWDSSPGKSLTFNSHWTVGQSDHRGQMADDEQLTAVAAATARREAPANVGVKNAAFRVIRRLQQSALQGMPHQ